MQITITKTATPVNRPGSVVGLAPGSVDGLDPGSVDGLAPGSVDCLTPGSVGEPSSSADIQQLFMNSIFLHKLH